MILDLKAGVTCMDIDPVRSCYLAIATCNQPVVRVFDRRMISDNSLGKLHYFEILAGSGRFDIPFRSLI